eukprot:jgi/Bigna1/143837/aug1.81_g18545
MSCTNSTLNKLNALIKCNKKEAKLKHDMKETTWEDHGDVSVEDIKGRTLAYGKQVVHNKNFSKSKKAFDDLAKTAISKVE